MEDESPVEAGTTTPYRVEMVGVTCDPGLAVARGIWRQVCINQEFLAFCLCLFQKLF